MLRAPGLLWRSAKGQGCAATHLNAGVYASLAAWIASELTSLPEATAAWASDCCLSLSNGMDVWSRPASRIQLSAADKTADAPRADATARRGPRPSPSRESAGRHPSARDSRSCGLDRSAQFATETRRRTGVPARSHVLVLMTEVTVAQDGSVGALTRRVRRLVRLPEVSSFRSSPSTGRANIQAPALQ